MKYNKKITGIRSDHGKKFENAKFNEFCNDLGINYDFSMPRAPQQNCVVERKNKTLVDITRTTLIDAKITQNFWDEVVNTTFHEINRCLIRFIIDKTPYKLMTKRKPKLSYLKSFGRKCFVLNNGKNNL